MIRTIIKTEKAPTPAGTYSQAVKASGLLFVAGQLPVKPGVEGLVSEDPVMQLKQCFENIQNICLEAGTSLDNAVKINVYYTELAVSDAINGVMEELFHAPYPARIRVKVAGLSRNAKVEIDGVFTCPN